MSITKASLIDLNGQELILDADADTSITADTDDQIDIKIAGSDKIHIVSTGLGINGTSTINADLHLGAASPHIDIGPAGGNRGKVGFDSNNVFIGSTSGTGEVILKNNIGSTDGPEASGDELARFGDTIVFNESGNDLDFRVEGDSNANLISIDAGNDRIGFGGTPLTDYHFYVRDAAESVFVTDQRAYTVSGRGGHLGFGGIYNSSSQTTAWAGIKGLAESTSDGNFAGSLSFFTRPNGGANTSRMHITSSGEIGIGTTSPNDYDNNSAGVSSDLVVVNSGHSGIIVVSGTSSDAGIFFGDGTGAAAYRGAVSYVNSQDALYFKANGANKLIIESDGDLNIQDGNLIVASGHGIDFSATANSSATGASMSSELLDDYEEGSFTPAISAVSGNAATYTVHSAQYVKIGKLVTVSGYMHSIDMTQMTSGTYVIFTGLPFTCTTYGDFNISYRRGGTDFQGGYVQQTVNYAYFVDDNGAEIDQSNNQTMTAFMFNFSYLAD